MKDELIGKDILRGFSTLEILIAFAILTLSLTAIVGVVFSNQSLGVDTQTNIEAISKAETQLEQQRALSRQDFSLVQSVAPVTDDIYTKKIDVVSVNASTKQVTSTVSWQTGGRNLSVVFTTLVSDSQGFVGSCNPTLTGDWSNPQHTEFHSEDLISPASGNHSNGLGISDIKAYGTKLYVAAISTGTFTNTFYIFNLPTNPTQMPVYVGSVDNAPSTSDGLNAFVVYGKYAYVASAHDANFQTCSIGASCAQLQVIDINSPTNPTVVANFKIPSATSPFVLGNQSGSNGQAVGKSIFYSNGYIYLGLTKTASGPEFNIIDVHNPLNPTWVGSYAVGRTVNSILVKNNYAYLATDDNSRELLVLDISNKANPTAVGLFDAPGAVGFGYGRSTSLVGTTMYFGRSYVGTAPELYILNAANPASALPILGSKDIGPSSNPDSVNGLSVRSNLAFLLTNTAFEIWDISNPSSITSFASLPMSSFITSGNPANAAGTSLNCSGNYFYISLISPQGNNKDIVSVITPFVPSTFALTNSGNLSITQGSSGSETITNTATSGFPSGSTLTASGLPAGASASFTNNACTPTCASTLTISTLPTTLPGSYPITVTGGSQSTTFTLTVVATAFDYSITSAPNPTTVTRAGISVGNTVTIAMLSGTPQNVTVTPTGLTAGTAVSPSSAACTPSASSPFTCSVTFNYTASAGAVTGAPTITLNAANPAHSTSFTLKVQAPAFDYSLSLTAPSITMGQNSTANQTVTVTITPGAVAQAVSIAFSNLQNHVSVSPAPGSCTPIAGSCSIPFTITAASNAQKQTNTITVTATSPTHTIPFSLKVQ